MYKICFITTISMTINAFIRKFADYLYETDKFEIYFICDNDKEFEASLPEHIKYIPIPMKRGISLGGIKSTIELVKTFKKYKFDLIQYSTPNASFYAALAGTIARIPVRLYCQWGIAYIGFRGIKRKVFKVIERFVCKASTWIEPDSKSNLEFSHSEGLYPEGKGSVIWNGSASGVDLEKFDISSKEEWREEIRDKYSIPNDGFVYIFVGRITRDKGMNELFASAKQLLYNHDDVYFLMVGNNEVSDDVDKDLYEWSLSEKNMIYCGFTDEVEKYMAASDVYVLPSYREGFGSAVIEAEAMGLPVIVTNIPGPINAMKRDITGIIVEKGSVKDLIAAMERLKGDAREAEFMGKEAYKFAVNSFEQKSLFERLVKDRMNLLSRRVS